MAKVKAKKSEVIVETKKDIKQKQKKLKMQKQKDVSETEETIRRFFSILILLVVIIAAVYFMTNRSSNKTNTVEVAIQYDDISVGMILNRSEYSEYYVLAFFDDGEKYDSLKKLYKTYRNEDDSKKLYTVDLNDKINKNYVNKDKTANVNVEKVTDFNFTTDTLLYIKDGKIVESYTTYESIENLLK